MRDTEISAVAAAAAIVVVTVVAVWIWKGLNLAWLRPKKHEAYLKRQGLSGTPFTFLIGDAKKEASMVEQAKSRPISLADDYTSRVIPLILQTVKDHGPTASVIVTKPEHIKEVLTDSTISRSRHCTQADHHEKTESYGKTTAELLVWTMIMLSHHQKWQDKARDEILQVIGNNNKPNFDALSRSPRDSQMGSQRPRRTKSRFFRLDGDQDSVQIHAHSNLAFHQIIYSSLHPNGSNLLCGTSVMDLRIKAEFQACTDTKILH
ncbi:hypothetical protein EUTSA_v10022297mg [Eutrema salsugineum]|uniref:Uncharacterized protein n=1 Tax=Eutrema salsugineum TaxID=72664 RepID=V4M848_EUTSA|nr:hypothetical protein EUTSA_v10022297mg [Eutrema salsugineum]